ncbi:hypothetical protein KGA66_29100 [Actinocrinis puniceicyclus]|uniref:Uncharacterized protein n=1 Tax=Actinocrinis puniceicyclus TaxID=977794 RepID=A0A8J7WVX1_9ACTN|nr:hypothetical protein [Actinocrinis puniceicyclus]MBS2967124.1 hypothetical protein [Actinocrinis puniceicyclus]
MFDPFTDPAVLVHEVDGPVFEDSWHRFDPGDDARRCPVCGQGRAQERGESQRKQRPWIRYACGDVIAQEITAG